MKVKKESLIATLCAAYDFFAHNPGATSGDLAEEFGLPTSTGRSRARALVARRCVTTGTCLNHRHQQCKTYFVVEGKRPDGNSVIDPQFYGARFIPADAKRIIVKAQNCGMKPDPLALPREFFGEARAVA